MFGQQRRRHAAAAVLLRQIAAEKAGFADLGDALDLECALGSTLSLEFNL